MSKLSRLVDMASKALDKKSGNSGAQGSGDWRALVRNAADGLTGGPRTKTGPRQGLTPPPAHPGAPRSANAGTADDRAAIARYDYLMGTADPHRVEEIHREAFERLTPSQRAQVEARMNSDLRPHERPVSSSPGDLARAAGRSEAAQPGRMRRMLARTGAGAVGGAGIGLLGAVAGGAVLSAVAAPLLAQATDLGIDFDSLAQGVDLGGLADGVDVGGLTEGAEDFVADAGEHVSGLGEQVGGVGEQLGGLELPNLRDLFG